MSECDKDCGCEKHEDERKQRARNDAESRAGFLINEHGFCMPSGGYSLAWLRLV